MRQREGFTLVEMSIVLVIIGLLIGGILAAQSMIGTAKINATVRQVGQFDAMVMNFKTRFNYLPGDAPQFGGDGDGIIDRTAGCSSDNAMTAFCGEIGSFWNNASPEQYSATVFASPGSKATPNGTGKNVPEAKLGKSGSFFIASAISADTCFAATPQANYYALLDPSEAQVITAYSDYNFGVSTATTSSTRPVDMLALDTKMDDGLANSGNVLSGSIGNCGGSGQGSIGATPVAGICSSGAVYTVSNPGYECTPLIRIGGTTGDLQ